ncbi:MAG TPA: hypothetical protein PKO23_04650 [Candidatus Hydrogenedentes bacterium]|nr:hypothetical protein [Candidatus Hydrogenedentota bacterium]
MKSKYGALAWEQLRICRLPCAGIFLSLLSFLLVDALGDDSSRLYGIVFSPEEVAIFSLIVAGILIVLRREGQNRNGFGFQNRLLALPVSTFRLVCAVLGARVLCLLLLSGAVVVTLALYAGSPISANRLRLFSQGLPIPFLLYLGLQAWAWSVRALRGFLYLGLLALLFLPSVWTSFPNIVYNGNMLAESLLIFALYGMAAFLLAWLGVHYQRMDRQSRVPTIQSLYLMITSAFMPTKRKFTSALDAQLWFEHRRIGRQLYVLVPVITLAALWCSFAFDVDIHGRSLFYFAFIISAAITGFYRVKTEGFVFTRPIEIRTLVRAKYLATFRALVPPLFLLTLLMLALLFVLPFDRYVTTAFLRKGIIDPLYVAAMVIRPALISGALAWFISWAAAPMITRTLIVMILFTPMGIMREEFMLLTERPLFYSVIALNLWCIACLILGWRRAIIPTRVMLAVVCFWAVMLLAALAPSWFEAGEYNTGLLYLSGLIPLMFLPFVAVPFKMQSLRTG